MRGEPCGEALGLWAHGLRFNSCRAHELMTLFIRPVCSGSRCVVVEA